MLQYLCPKSESEQLKVLIPKSVRRSELPRVSTVRSACNGYLQIRRSVCTSSQPHVVQRYIRTVPQKGRMRLTSTAKKERPSVHLRAVQAGGCTQHTHIPLVFGSRMLSINLEINAAHSLG